MQIVRRVTRGKYVMNIVYTLNDSFVPQVGAGICSVCENNKRAHVISCPCFGFRSPLSN